MRFKYIQTFKITIVHNERKEHATAYRNRCMQDEYTFFKLNMFQCANISSYKFIMIALLGKLFMGFYICVTEIYWVFCDCI